MSAKRLSSLLKTSSHVLLKKQYVSDYSGPFEQVLQSIFAVVSLVLLPLAGNLSNFCNIRYTVFIKPFFVTYICIDLFCIVVLLVHKQDVSGYLFLCNNDFFYLCLFLNFDETLLKLPVYL